MFKKVTLGAAAALTAATAVTALPTPAEAHRSRSYHSHTADHGYYGRNYYRPRRCKSGTTGMIIGGAGGALLGREIAGRGNRSTGTILGAAVGALAGRELTRTKRRNC